MTRIDTTDATGFSPAAIKPRVSIGDIDKLDIRVGTIERVENVPKSDKLVKLVLETSIARLDGAAGRSPSALRQSNRSPEILTARN